MVSLVLVGWDVHSASCFSDFNERVTVVLLSMVLYSAVFLSSIRCSSVSWGPRHSKQAGVFCSGPNCS